MIDAQSAPLHWDRATVVHPRSLQIFESLGLVEQFLTAGCRQRVIKIHSGGKLLGTIDLAGCGSIYGFNVGLSEEVTESILTGYLHQHGGQVNRSSRLVGMTITPNNRVLADIERDGDRYQIEARWVVGCDGLHSATRDLAGIGFEGHDMLKPWAVFDASVEPWAHTFEATFVYLEALPVILTALPGHRWRVYLLPNSEDSDLVADATSTLRAYEPSAHFVDIENPARFRCHTKIATKYRSGPIFLAGDAAHLCSPGEGHGMNCGLQDAFNLAWKLALVHQGAAHETLLDSYEIERRPAAELVMKSGDDMEKTLNMADPTERKTRDQAIRTATRRSGDSAPRHGGRDRTEHRLRPLSDCLRGRKRLDRSRLSLARQHSCTHARTRPVQPARTGPSCRQYSDPCGRTYRKSIGVIGSPRRPAATCKRFDPV